MRLELHDPETSGMAAGGKAAPTGRKAAREKLLRSGCLSLSPGSAQTRDNQISNASFVRIQVRASTNRA